MGSPTQPSACAVPLASQTQATGHAKRGPQQLRDGSRKPGPGQAARGRTDLSTAACRLPPGTGHGPLAQGPPSASRGEPPDHAVRAVQPARSHGPGTGRAHLCLARGCLSRASTQLRPVSPAPLRGTACTPHVELASPGTAGLCPRLTRQPRQARHLRTHTPREGSRTRQSELAGTRHPEVGCGPNREKPRRQGSAWAGQARRPGGPSPLRCLCARGPPGEGALIPPTPQLFPESPRLRARPFQMAPAAAVPNSTA